MIRWLSPIVVLVWATATQIAAAGDRSLNDRFIAEYSEGFRRLEAFYRNIDMTEETTGPGADKKFGGKITFHWRSSGEKFRDDIISLSGAIAQSKISRGDVSYRIYTTTKARLAQVKPGEKYTITEIYRGDNNRLLSMARLISPRLAFSPYCIYGSTIMEVVKMDNVEVESFDETEPGKVRMICKVHVQGGRTGEFEFLFDKARSWALISHRHRNNWAHTDVEYGDSIDGVPVAKRVTQYLNGDTKTPAFVSVLKEIKPGPVPDSVFTLAEFGLPELPSPKKPGFPILTTLGLLGLAVSLALAWLIRRRRAPKVEVT